MTAPRKAGRVVTLTANPSLDRTLDLPASLTEGGIVRLAGSSTEPGGKGVNVARAVAAAGGDVVSILPAAASDPIVTALRGLGLELATVPVQAPVRTNYTLVDPAGTTTKLNEPGAPLTDATRTALTGVLHGHAATAQWVVLSGSLPRRPRPTGTPAWSARCATPGHASPSTPARRRCSRCWPRGPTRHPTCSSPTPRSWPSWPGCPRTTCCGTRTRCSRRCGPCTTAGSRRCSSRWGRRRGALHGRR
ncbi:hypothetical protein [Blastococcus brunescens]|uniref:hypothetical protein n=1 Tax=Blastococcus brunescens TaxID=1564165 RepID=UPI003BEF463B